MNSKSFYFLIYDLTICIILCYFAKLINNCNFYFQILSWPIYWLLQGSIFFAIWILGHECGHQAFSTNKNINNINFNIKCEK